MATGKRDPTDFSHADVEAVLHDPFGLTFETAREFDFPQPDYVARRQPFWWKETIEHWAQCWRVTMQERNARYSAFLDGEEARHRAEYERQQEAAASVTKKSAGR